MGFLRKASAVAAEPGALAAESSALVARHLAAAIPEL